MRHGGGGAWNGKGKGIVEVNPQPHKGLTSTLIDWVEKTIVKAMHESTKPHHFLSGSFSPVRHENPPTNDLPVAGHIPVSTITTTTTLTLSLHRLLFPFSF